MEWYLSDIRMRISTQQNRVFYFYLFLLPMLFISDLIIKNLFSMAEHFWNLKWDKYMFGTCLKREKKFWNSLVQETENRPLAILRFFIFVFLWPGCHREFKSETGSECKNQPTTVEYSPVTIGRQGMLDCSWFLSDLNSVETRPMLHMSVTFLVAISWLTA